MTARSGRHFLQVPGPTNVPDRVLRAIDMPRHRPSRPGIRGLAQARHGRHEAPAAQLGSGADLSLVGHRRVGGGAAQHAVARRQGAGVRDRPFRHSVAGDGRSSTGSRSSSCPATGATASIRPRSRRRLTADHGHAIKAVMVVHNETSTGVTSRRCRRCARRSIAARASGALHGRRDLVARRAIDYRHDDWGVDVTVCGSQKGLMLPPGLGFNAISPKAIAAHKTAKLPRAYFEWQPMIDANDTGFFPYTPPISLFFGLERSDRDARGGRARQRRSRATTAWPRRRGARCAPGASKSSAPIRRSYSSALTAIMMPEGAQRRRAARRRSSSATTCRSAPGSARSPARCSASAISAGSTSLMLIGALAGVEMGLGAAGVPHTQGRRRTRRWIISAAMSAARASRRAPPRRDERRGARRACSSRRGAASRRLGGARVTQPRATTTPMRCRRRRSRLLGARDAGWKVGSANPTAQPIAAPLIAPLVQRAPRRFTARPRASAPSRPSCALSLARDLPARATPYGEDEAWDAVASVHVAIELLDTRYADRTRDGAGRAARRHAEQWRLLLWPGDRKSAAVDFLARAGEPADRRHGGKSAVGGNPAGHPKRLLAWLANHAASRGRPSRQGMSSPPAAIPASPSRRSGSRVDRALCRAGRGRARPRRRLRPEFGQR